MASLSQLHYLVGFRSMFVIAAGSGELGARSHITWMSPADFHKHVDNNAPYGLHAFLTGLEGPKAGNCCAGAADALWTDC